MLNHITITGNLTADPELKQENKRRTAEIDVENVYFADARPSVKEG